MSKQYRYKNNLLVAYRTSMTLFLFTFLPIGLLTAFTVFVSLQRYQRHSAKAYVFHTGGASIEIYEPTGQQQQSGQAALQATQQRRAANARRAVLSTHKPLLRR